MNTTFEKAFAFVQKWEGGPKFTQDFNDPGGATKYGISYRFLKDLLLIDSDLNFDGVFSWKDVAALTEDKAKDIFEKYFWRKLHLQFFPDSLAIVMFDSAVNIGRSRTVKFLQEALGSKIVIDGFVGPQTLQAVHDATKGGLCFRTSLLTSFVLDRRELHYSHLILSSEWAEKYYQGWMNRTNDLRNLIKEMESCDE